VTGLARFTEKLPSRSRPVVLTCVYGLGAGLAAVAFQVGMNTLYRLGIVRLSQASTVIFLLGSLVVIVTTSLAVGFLLTRFASEASGSGIPQLKAAFWKDFGVVPWRVVWVKYVAGVLSIGGGCSLGREGPSVQLAGGVASNLAGVLGEAKQKRRAAAAAGAAAGLAAAFNTPLAAVTFVLEEILVQDGHQLEHVIPPRDLRSWQQLPVAAIANFHRVTVGELNTPQIKKLLRAHPYERFPVVGKGTVTGILTRREAQAAQAANRAPKLEPAVTCLRNQNVAELQARLIESNSMIVVLLDRPGGQVLGVVTLHDLLRAQAAMSEASAG
jgi:H+/Cl- antiporter ClcA